MLKLLPLERVSIRQNHFIGIATKIPDLSSTGEEDKEIQKEHLCLLGLGGEYFGKREKK